MNATSVGFFNGHTAGGVPPHYSLFGDATNLMDVGVDDATTYNSATLGDYTAGGAVMFVAWKLPSATAVSALHATASTAGSFTDLLYVYGSSDGVTWNAVQSTTGSIFGFGSSTSTYSHAVGGSTPYAYWCVAVSISSGTVSAKWYDARIYDSSASVVGPPVTASPPSAPTSLTATGGSLQVALSWGAVSGIGNYIIYRSTTSGGPYTNIDSSGTNSYTDYAVTGGVTYYYVVTARNAAVAGGLALESAYSNQASATPSSVAVPSAPTGLSAAAGFQLSGYPKATLTWTASSGATSYKAYRALMTGGPYTLLGSVSASPYEDDTVSYGTTYYYVVKAHSAAGDSGYSSEASVAIPALVVPAYTNLWANGSSPAASAYANAPLLVDLAVDDDTTGYTGS